MSQGEHDKNCKCNDCLLNEIIARIAVLGTQISHHKPYMPPIDILGRLRSVLVLCQRYDRNDPTGDDSEAT